MTTTELTPEQSAAIEQNVRQDRLGFAVRNDFVDKAATAIDNGANPNTLHPSGKTFLMIAIAKNCQAMVNLLVDRGADLEMADKDGDTALTTALQYGNAAAVRLLVERGAIVDGVQSPGSTRDIREMLDNAPTLRAAFVEATRHAASVATQARLKEKKPKLSLRPKP